MLLKHIAGLNIARYRPVNKGVKRPKLADVPPDILIVILNLNFIFSRSSSLTFS